MAGGTIGFIPVWAKAVQGRHQNVHQFLPILKQGKKKVLSRASSIKSPGSSFNPQLDQVPVCAVLRIPGCNIQSLPG